MRGNLKWRELLFNLWVQRLGLLVLLRLSRVVDRQRPRSMHGRHRAQPPLVLLAPSQPFETSYLTGAALHLQFNGPGSTWTSGS